MKNIKLLVNRHAKNLTTIIYPILVISSSITTSPSNSARNYQNRASFWQDTSASSTHSKDSASKTN